MKKCSGAIVSIGEPGPGRLKRACQCHFLEPVFTTEQYGDVPGAHRAAEVAAETPEGE